MLFYDLPAICSCFIIIIIMYAEWIKFRIHGKSQREKASKHMPVGASLKYIDKYVKL